MSVGYGIRAGYVIESTYGNDPGGTLNWIGLIQSIRPTVDRGIIKKKGMGSVIHDFLIPGPRGFEFTIDFLLQDTNMIKYAIQNSGGSATRGINESLKSFTFEIAINDVYFNLLGSKINRLTVRSRIDEEVTASMNLICKTVNTYTSQQHASPTASSTAPVIFSGTKIERPSGTDLFASEFSFEINNNLKRINKFNVSGASDLDTLIEGALEATGTATIWFENKSLWDEVASATANNIIASYKHSTTNTITFGSAVFDTGEVSSEVDTPAVYTLAWDCTGVTYA